MLISTLNFCKFSIKGHFTWNHPKFPLPMHSSKGSRPRTSSFKHSRRSSFHKLKRWLWLWKKSMILDPQDVKFPLEIIAIMFILIKESFRGSHNIFHWRSLNADSKATINRIIDLSIDVEKGTLALNLGDFLKRFVGITVWWIGEGCWFTMMGNFDSKGIIPSTQLFQAKPLVSSDREWGFVCHFSSDSPTQQNSQVGSFFGAKVWLWSWS